MPLDRAYSRCQVLLTCMSLMHTQGLSENPRDAPSAYGPALTPQFDVAKVRAVRAVSTVCAGHAVCDMHAVPVQVSRVAKRSAYPQQAPQIKANGQSVPASQVLSGSLI